MNVEINVCFHTINRGNVKRPSKPSLSVPFLPAAPLHGSSSSSEWSATSPKKNRKVKLVGRATTHHNTQSRQDAVPTSTSNIQQKTDILSGNVRTVWVFEAIPKRSLYNRAEGLALCEMVPWEIRGVKLPALETEMR